MTKKELVEDELYCFIGYCSQKIDCGDSYYAWEFRDEANRKLKRLNTGESPDLIWDEMQKEFANF